MSKAMDDETLDELAKRWCLKGIFKMGMKETAERARVDAWELVVEVRRLRDHLFAVTAERDEALAALATARREGAEAMRADISAALNDRALRIGKSALPRQGDIAVAFGDAAAAARRVPTPAVRTDGEAIGHAAPAAQDGA